MRATRATCSRVSGHDQQPLFAAPTAQAVLTAQLGHGGSGKGFEHAVARGMAIAVVDLLESVEVDQGQ